MRLLAHQGTQHAKAPPSCSRRNRVLLPAYQVLQVTDQPGSLCSTRMCHPGMPGWLFGRALPTGEDFSSTKWEYSSTEFMEKRFKNEKEEMP